MKKIIYFLIAFAMLSFASCCNNSCENNVPTTDSLETVNELDTIQNDEVNDTTTWFEIDENGEPVVNF